MLTASRDPSYLGVNHEPQHVCNVVECEESILAVRPELLPVGVSILHQSPYSVDHLGISDSDLEVWALLIPLKSQYIFPHCHLNGVYYGRKLVELLLAFALKIDLEGPAVFFVEVERRGYVKVVHETCDVEQHGVASLSACQSASSERDQSSYLSHTEQLDSCLATIQDALLGLDLLEDEVLCHLTEVCRE